MKSTKYSTRSAYIGGGCGLIFFAVFGLLPGSFFGGVMGLNIAGFLFGMPVSSGVLSRLIVAASMVVGVMASGIIFITASSTACWLLGNVADALSAEKRNLAAVEHR